MNNELYHHGIKGQKWGVRRYQDKSGRLTPAGKKRARTKDSFDTTYRPTILDKSDRLIETKPGGVTKHQYKKAKRSAYKEGQQYLKTFKSQARQKDELSVMGNKYDSEIKKYSDKNAKRTINEINEKQRQKDIYDIADQNEKNLTKKQRIAKNAALVGAGAAYIGMAAAMGAGVNGKKGAGMVAAAAAGQVGILGLTAVAASKYADKKFKKTDAEIRKLCNKLEDNGYKVSEQKTYMSYTVNGQYQGATNTKRYNLSGDTKPYREDYQYNVQYMYV